MERKQGRRGRRTLLGSIAALGLLLLIVALGCYAALYSGALPYREGLVIGPGFRGTATRGAMIVKVSDYRIVCSAANGDYNRVTTFQQDTFLEPGETASSRGYRIEAWYGLFIVADEGAAASGSPTSLPAAARSAGRTLPSNRLPER